MKQLLITLLFFLFSLSFLHAQQSLRIHKSGTKKHYYVMTGDSLRLQLEGQTAAMSGPWGFYDKETIIFADTLIRLKDIDWIDIAEMNPGDRLGNIASDLLLMAGVGYFAVDQANMLVETGNFHVSKGVAIFSASAVAGGLLIKLFNRVLRDKKARIGRRYTITVTDHST